MWVLFCVFEFLFVIFCLFFRHLFRNLTDEQRRLLVAYAQLETDTPGQIKGIEKKKNGKGICFGFRTFWLIFLFLFFLVSNESASTDKEDSENHGTYAAQDDQISFEEREKRRKEGGFSANPWAVMFRETVTTPFARRLTAARVVLSELLSRKKS